MLLSVLYKNSNDQWLDDRQYNNKLSGLSNALLINQHRFASVYVNEELNDRQDFLAWLTLIGTLAAASNVVRLTIIFFEHSSLGYNEWVELLASMPKLEQLNISTAEHHIIVALACALPNFQCLRAMRVVCRDRNGEPSVARLANALTDYWNCATVREIKALIGMEAAEQVLSCYLRGNQSLQLVEIGHACAPSPWLSFHINLAMSHAVARNLQLKWRFVQPGSQFYRFD